MAGPQSGKNGGVSPDSGGPLRIAMLSPPWIEVPPPGYGGVELVVDLLSCELTRRGHHVTLFAPPGSETAVTEVVDVLERPHPDEIQVSLYESDHVATVFDQVDAEGEAGRPFDIVHDHSSSVAFAFANRLRTPVLHTLHGPFTDETRAFYRRHASKAWAVAISRYQAEQAPPNLRVVGVTPNPLVVEDFPYRAEKDDYLLFVARMNEEKGPHRAIAAARAAGARLLLAGPVQPGWEEFFATEVEPHLDGDRIVYVGEVGGERKTELFAGARALLMPIRWPEPFGLVMTEAMACGTPVIAFPEGSVPDIVEDGRSGFVVEDEDEMARAVERLDEIDPAACRAEAAERFDVAPVVDLLLAAYRTVIAEAPADVPDPALRRAERRPTRGRRAYHRRAPRARRPRSRP